MAGRESRMLFCVMARIQRHADIPLESFTEFADDPN
jgi:hypothetical protein